MSALTSDSATRPDPFLSPKQSLDLKRAYRDAVELQCACNPSGILASWGRAMDVIRMELGFAPASTHRITVSTLLISRHPITVLYASKLHDIANLGLSDSGRYGAAYSFADNVSRDAYLIGSVGYYEALLAYYDSVIG